MAHPVSPAGVEVREGERVVLRRPRRGDYAAFAAAVTASRKLHGRWVQPPVGREAFDLYVARLGRRVDGAHPPPHIGLLAFRREDGALVGAVNFGDIVRGALQSAYLGYFGFAPHACQGYMTEALALAVDFGFRTLGLHRLEINVQPANERSLALALRCGFRREGYSPRYLKIAGRWRDHVRLALLAEEWRATGAGRRR